MCAADATQSVPVVWPAQLVLDARTCGNLLAQLTTTCSTSLANVILVEAEVPSAAAAPAGTLFAKPCLIAVTLKAVPINSPLLVLSMESTTAPSPDSVHSRAQPACIAHQPIVHPPPQVSAVPAPSAPPMQANPPGSSEQPKQASHNNPPDVRGETAHLIPAKLRNPAPVTAETAVNTAAFAQHHTTMPANTVSQYSALGWQGAAPNALQPKSTPMQGLSLNATFNQPGGLALRQDAAEKPLPSLEKLREAWHASSEEVSEHIDCTKLLMQLLQVKLKSAHGKIAREKQTLDELQEAEPASGMLDQCRQQAERFSRIAQGLRHLLAEVDQGRL